MAACTVASSPPASTRSPVRTASTTPAPGSITSSSVSRPAPASIAARPTPAASKPATKPRSSARTSRVIAARGSSAGSSMTAGSPPWAATHARIFASAAPDAMTPSTSSRPCSWSRAAPAITSIRAEEVRATSMSAGEPPSPQSTRTASATSRALPTQLPSGSFMSVSSQTTSRPKAWPTRVSSLARARASAIVRMNAPEPTLTSRRIALAPPATFLLMIEPTMRGMLATVAVTSRSA